MLLGSLDFHVQWRTVRFKKPVFIAFVGASNNMEKRDVLTESIEFKIIWDVVWTVPVPKPFLHNKLGANGFAFYLANSVFGVIKAEFFTSETINALCYNKYTSAIPPADWL